MNESRSFAMVKPVDYEKIAATYDRRYATNDSAGMARCLRDFLGDARAVAELGCGTGHWLAVARACFAIPGRS